MDNELCQARDSPKMFHVKHFCKVCPARNALRLVGFSAINSAKGARQQDEDGPIKLLFMGRILHLKTYAVTVTPKESAKKTS